MKRQNLSLFLFMHLFLFTCAGTEIQDKEGSDVITVEVVQMDLSVNPHSVIVKENYFRN